MSCYFIKGKGWRYDFTLNGKRYTETWFKTKKEARKAEEEKRKELSKPVETIPTDMAFLDLVNRRLDHVKAYNSERHYREYLYMAKRWVERWGKLNCSAISSDDIEKFIIQRSRISAFTANKEIRYLRATFNFGRKKKLLNKNPTEGIDFLPVEKRLKYIPPADDIDRVIMMADADARDYLWTIRETMARVSEINRLTWDDVDLVSRQVTLYTRKKKGGHLTPRRVPMTNKLFDILAKRNKNRDNGKPWVFWQCYKSNGTLVTGPFSQRKNLMKGLCRKAGVRHFGFHALRHAGASVMDNNNVPIVAIQKILGHENRATTEIYLQGIGDFERKAMAVYEAARLKSHTDSHTEEKRDPA
ncbi:MAG: site-specific integrase [Desulfobulbales bacterium]